MFMRLALLVVVSILLGCQTSPKTLIRLSPDGPEGVGLKNAEIEGQREYIYYSAPTSERISSGIWEGDPYEEGPDTEGASEFMYIINGSATIVDEHGREEALHAGDAILVPRGVTYYWKQSKLRMFWVIFDEGEPEDWADRTAANSYIRFEPHGPEGKLNGEGGTREHMYYAARGEKLSAGVWEADASMSDQFHEPDYTELMCILQGSVTIIDDAGNEELVQAGDVVLVPKGMRYQWKQGEYIRKYWVIFDAD